MKKVLFSVAMIATFVGVMMTSCKKENETVLYKKVPTEINNPQNDAVVRRILDFKKKVDERKSNPDMKSEETMTLERAINSVVDLFNVTYTHPMAFYTVLESHQFSINVPLTIDGEVLVDDVVAAYEQVVNEAREAYHGSLLTNKSYRRLMVTVEMQRDGEVVLDFNGSYGEIETTPSDPPPHIDGPFSEGDDWHYKDGMGSCDGIRPGGADKVLQDTIMKEVRSLWPADPNGCIGFYTDFVIHNFSPSSGSTDIFFRINSDDTCIEWPYMNDYLAGERRIIFQEVPQEYGINLNGNPMQQYRYYVTNVLIEGRGDEYTGPIYHWTEIEYARYNYIENGVIEGGEL